MRDRRGRKSAKNVRDPQTGRPKPIILYNFGRADQVDKKALRRLVRSVARFLPPEEQAQIQQQIGGEWPFEYLGSRKLGGIWLLDWLGVGGRGGLHRGPARSGGAPLNRAMDFLLEAAEEIQRELFWAIATLLNLEVDVIFLDTTTTYFEIEGEDLARRPAPCVPTRPSGATCARPARGGWSSTGRGCIGTPSSTGSFWSAAPTTSCRPMIWPMGTNSCGRWHQMKQLLCPIGVGRHRTANGEVWQVRPLRTEQKDLFQALHLDIPPRYLKIQALHRKAP